MDAMDSAIILRPLAEEMRKRAETIRAAAVHWEKAAAKDRDLAEVLDAVATKVADGEIAPAAVAAVLTAARPHGNTFGTANKDENEAEKLRRFFSLPARAL